MPDGTSDMSSNCSLAERPQPLRKQTVCSAEILFSKLSSYSKLRPEEMLPSFAKLSEVLRTSDRVGKTLFSVSHKSEGAEKNRETNKKWSLRPSLCSLLVPASAH